MSCPLGSLVDTILHIIGRRTQGINKETAILFRNQGCNWWRLYYPSRLQIWYRYQLWLSLVPNITSPVQS